MPEARYFSMPSIEVGSVAFRNCALNCSPCVRSFCQMPLAVTHSPAEIEAACASDRHEVLLPAHFDAKHAKAVLLVVKRHPLRKPGENLLFVGREHQPLSGHANQMRLCFL